MIEKAQFLDSTYTKRRECSFAMPFLILELRHILYYNLYGRSITW